MFGDLPEVSRPCKKDIGGAPRLREPVRDRIELRAVALDGLIGADHPARVLWAYVEGLDLGVLEAPIMAREGLPGHPPIAPRLMLALWLYATSDGVGSARALARLCESHDAYRWLCGGVSVNYHTLSGFRLGHPGLLDDLLTRNVAALSAAGVIDLDEVTQDGMRVRAVPVKPDRIPIDKKGRREGRPSPTHRFWRLSTRSSTTAGSASVETSPRLE